MIPGGLEYICFNEACVRDREMDYVQEPMTK